MILQALYEYYNRKASDPNNFIAPEGWEWKAIPFRIVINRVSKFITIEDTREGEGRIKRAKNFLVPLSVKRTVGKQANLLWDNLEYALGANPRNRDDIEERFMLFKKRIQNEIDLDSTPAVKALLKFLNNEPLKQIEQNYSAELWQKILEENPFVVFKIDEENHSCVCDEIRKIMQIDNTELGDGICLITGEKGNIARLHPTIKGVRGGNTQGGALVSYNLAAFSSYGKKQNYNSPVSKGAAFAYTTALNILLGKDSHNKITIADSTIVFWAEKKTEEINPEEIFPWVIAMQKTEQDDPDAGVNKIKKLVEAVKTGQLSSERTNHFYVLGLAPNAARISVRFWKAPSVEDFGKNIKQHFEDFEIVQSDNKNKFISLYEILSSVSLETNKRDKPNIIYYKGKVYDILPQLAGQVVEAVLDNYLYPQSLVQQCIIRIRAEASKKDKNGKLIPNVTRTRTAILKAYLNRKNRIQKLNKKEITMSLDTNNTNVGYLLGRLFSVIERAQFVSNNYKEPNSGIRDRFFGAFSSSPISVLPILEKLYSHHYKKIKNERKFREANRLEDWKKDIIDKIEAIKIPAHLTLENQALFTIGYYHQKLEIENQKNSKSEIQSNNQIKEN